MVFSMLSMVAWGQGRTWLAYHTWDSMNVCMILTLSFIVRFLSPIHFCVVALVFWVMFVHVSLMVSSVFGVYVIPSIFSLSVFFNQVIGQSLRLVHLPIPIIFVFLLRLSKVPLSISYLLNIWSIFSMSSKLVEVVFMSSMNEPIFCVCFPICTPVVSRCKVLFSGSIFMMYKGPLAGSPCLRPVMSISIPFPTSMVVLQLWCIKFMRLMVWSVKPILFITLIMYGRLARSYALNMSVERTYPSWSLRFTCSIVDARSISGVVMFLPGIEHCCQGPIIVFILLSSRLAMILDRILYSQHWSDIGLSCSTVGMPSTLGMSRVVALQYLSGSWFFCMYWLYIVVRIGVIHSLVFL